MQEELELFQAIRESEIIFKIENRKRKLEKEAKEECNNFLPVEIIFVIYDKILESNIKKCLVCKHNGKKYCNHVTSHEFKQNWKCTLLCKRYKNIVLDWIETRGLIFMGDTKNNNVYTFVQVKDKCPNRIIKEYHIICHGTKEEGYDFSVHQYETELCSSIFWTYFLLEKKISNKWKTVGVVIHQYHLTKLF